MAEKGEGKTGRKRVKKAKAEGGPGHNLSELRESLEDFLKRMDQIKDDQETANGEFMVDIQNLKEEIANKTGHTRAHLQKVYTKHRRALKEEQERAEMEASELDALDTLMAAIEGLKDTPLGRAAVERAKG